MVLPWQGKAGGKRQGQHQSSHFQFAWVVRTNVARCLLHIAANTQGLLSFSASTPHPASCARSSFLFPFHFRFLPVPVYFALPLHWLFVQFLLQLTFWQHRIGDFASFVSVRGLQSSLERNGG